MTEGEFPTGQKDGRRLGRLSEPPLIVQLMALLFGALVAAQLVTLLLTIIIPPNAPREYALTDIADALLAKPTEGRSFDRTIQSGPPDVSARGWFVSDAARTRLAGLLGRPTQETSLGFFTQLPVGGTVDPVGLPSRLPDDAKRLRPPPISSVDPISNGVGSPVVPAAFETAETQPRLISAVLFQQMPGGPPGGGFPGGPPGGGFPGTGLPGGGFPQSLPRPGGPQPQNIPQRQPQPGPTQRQQQFPQQSPNQPQSQARQQTAPAGQPQGQIPTQSAAPQSTMPGQTHQGQPQPSAAPPGQAPGTLPNRTQSAGNGRSADMPERLRPVTLPMMQGIQSRPSNEAAPSPERRIKTLPEPAGRTKNDDSSGTPASREVEIEEVAPTIPSGATSPFAGDRTSIPRADDTGVSEPPRLPLERPVPIVRSQNGLFGLAPAPFVEGDFVAGIRLADGRWAVVSPRAEGFPNAWQRRVGLWFLLSLLAVAPVAWLFARRIVGPLNEFAFAADVLGRDPSAAVLPLRGPAEIGRAAHAFNQMQSRLRSFVDDRTAMLGAISHDLRTPLTRLRFRIEDVPEDQQDDLRSEVAEMEEMISSVIAFMRDASVPSARERRDLAEIVDDVIEDATLLGDVKAVRMESAIVDVDPLGVRRVLNNLLTNAIKYGGGHVRVALTVDRNCAVADIVDDGPGVDDGEIERIFEPFYRSEAARRSDRDGSGLGLAVCRSIARAHGGDVSLFHSVEGFTARVTLPLAFNDDRRAA